MTLHYLHPRHGEPCHFCIRGEIRDLDPDCSRCHGTGRVGGDAEPVINVFRFDHMGRECWWWVPVGTSELNGRGDYPTESDALFAGRCVLAGVEVYFERAEASLVHGGCYFWRKAGSGVPGHGHYPARDAALAAALDAQP